MLFSDCIPEKLHEYPNVSAFMKVLDSLHSFKTDILAEALRVDNFATLMDKKWLLKKLCDFGVTDIPSNYPIQIIQQYLLNVDTICRTHGSKIGLELYCSVLSLGEVEIDDSEFYSESPLILLDSHLQGFVTDRSDSSYYHLCGDNDITETSLMITIKSKYFNGDYPNEAEIIKQYLESSVEDAFGFQTHRGVVSFNYQERSDFYFHNLLNTNFI